MSKSICVFASSSMNLNQQYKDQARNLGRLMGKQGWRLVFGGGKHGLMGETARGIHETGGTVLGIIPKVLDQEHIAYAESDEWIVTVNLRDRKELMEKRSDAYIVLPGGVGTLEEMMETLTMKQLDYHQKPIIVLNTNGYYDTLLQFLDHMVAESFLKKDHLKLIQVVTTPEDAINAITEYNTPDAVSKY